MKISYQKIISSSLITFFCFLFFSSSTYLTGYDDAEAGFPVLKRKVAIARFSNETQSGVTFLMDDSGDRLGKQASDILSARLSDTGKFIMFERMDKDEIDSEKIIAGLKEEGIGVDFLIIGSVSEFGRSTDSEGKVFKRTKNQRAFAKVNVRLVDVSTGRIVFSQEGAGESVTTTVSKPFNNVNAGYDQSLTDKAISQAISSLVSNLVEKLTDKPWKSYFLSKENELYIIAGGKKQGLNPGRSLYVYKKGKTIKNPQTGGMIELPGTKSGSIKVLYSVGEDEFTEVSFVQLSQGSLEENLEDYYILERDI